LTDINNKLKKHALVKDCCVAPKPDQVKVELVAVIVASHPLEISEEDFLKQLNALLPPIQRLTAFLILDKMPSVPSGGKIDKVRIANLVKEKS
jgi:acyl-CoA synthetase (AMP-forming)/AMP-acid ligase II